MLSDINHYLKKINGNKIIIELSARPLKDGKALQSFTIELSGKSQLDRILSKLQSLEGLIDIKY